MLLTLSVVLHDSALLDLINYLETILWRVNGSVYSRNFCGKTFDQY